MCNKGMKNHVRRAAACFLAGSMTLAVCGVSASATGTSLVGVGTSVTEEDIRTASETEAATEETEASAGETEAVTEETITEETAPAEEVSVEETAAPAENIVGTVAVSQLGEETYINIRSNPSTDAEIVGKLYNNNAATVLADDGEWLYIQSGNCEGYVAKYLMTTGSAAAEVAQEIGTPVAQVNVEGLMVRSDASEDAQVLDMVTQDQVVYLEEDLGGWAKVTTENGISGYVSADYVSYATYLPQAESAEEEAARLAAEEQAYLDYLAEQERLYLEAMAAEQAAWEAQNQAWIEYLESQGMYADDAQANADQAYADQAYADQMAADAQANADAAYNSGDADAAAQAQAEADRLAAEAQAAADAAAQAQAEADAAAQAEYEAATQVLQENGVDPSTIGDGGTSDLRQQVVDYALQFVGNPYVWGGTSLTNGADCSGFTQSVLADNGINVSRTAGQQGQGGTSVDLSNIQPGDLLFYEGSGDYGIGHVSMYIGDGQVVHASNSTDGIIVSDINYRTPSYAKSYLD